MLLLLLILGCQPESTPQGKIVKVTRVVSGNTLEVIGLEAQRNFNSRVRLIGIDAPDLQQQPWGQTAKQQLETIVQGNNVLLEFDVQEKDSFGRYQAYVWHDKVLLNELLVAHGYVLAVARNPNDKYTQQLNRAQESARLMERGIWNPSQPMRFTPAEFRRQLILRRHRTQSLLYQSRQS
ncbi:thermonuclease family protein [Gloeocapsopsis dulcis]|uniref:thermonuclease family protein n=1 Tax=Gloeocapsopsis dulcis TaxID=2859516 RepID=UPI001F26DA19|nr:thermonuclease family protein [Gloeocapsopsis dulcis]WNN88955.1 thermonuclease family protein [Gloeocapsopsis dulcis]